MRRQSSEMGVIPSADEVKVSHAMESHWEPLADKCCDCTVL